MDSRLVLLEEAELGRRVTRRGADNQLAKLDHSSRPASWLQQNRMDQSLSRSPYPEVAEAFAWAAFVQSYARKRYRPETRAEVSMSNIERI
jgi:hypothetical protein